MTLAATLEIVGPIALVVAVLLFPIWQDFAWSVQNYLRRRRQIRSWAARVRLEEASYLLGQGGR